MNASSSSKPVNPKEDRYGKFFFEKISLFLIFLIDSCSNSRTIEKHCPKPLYSTVVYVHVDINGSGQASPPTVFLAAMAANRKHSRFVSGSKPSHFLVFACRPPFFPQNESRATRSIPKI